MRSVPGAWRLFQLLVPALALVGLPALAQASGVAFEDFAPPAFQEAIDRDRPILLVLDVPWSEYSRRAETDLWADPRVSSAIREGFVPVRARADLRPDLMRRFPAEGWPAMTVLLPDGSPLFLALGEGSPRRVTSGYRPAEELAAWLRAASSYYSERRASAIELSRRGIDRMRFSAVPEAGNVSRDLLWRVGIQLRNTFDADARYFGGAPRLPRFDLIELMMQLGSEDQPEWALLGLGALETLGKELGDPESGALYRMAVKADWSLPQREMLLDRNARFLELLGLAYRATGKTALRERGLEIARFLSEDLGREDGSFMAGVCAACPGGVDPTVLSADVALASAALMRAGAAFDAPELVARGLSGARFLAESRFEAGKGLARSVSGEARLLEVHLEDMAEGTLAFLAAYEASGERVWLDRAMAVQAIALRELSAEGLTCLADRPLRPSGPAPLRFALYPMKANARNARALLKLHRLTGSETYRESALGILRAFGASYQRLLLHAPAFAVALYEAEFEPIDVQVLAGEEAGSEADRLRRAALQAEYPHVVVRSGVIEDAPGSAILRARQGKGRLEGTPDYARVRAELARLRLVALGDGVAPDPRDDPALPNDFERPPTFRGSTTDLTKESDSEPDESEGDESDE